MREGVIELVGGGVPIDSTPKSHEVRELSLDGDLRRQAAPAARRTERVAPRRRHRMARPWVGVPGASREHLRANVLTHTFRRYAEDRERARIRLHDLRHTQHRRCSPSTEWTRRRSATAWATPAPQFSLDNYVHPAQARQSAAANLFAGLIDDAGSGPARVRQTR